MPSHQSVFKDEAKLDINYIPQKLPHREKEHRLLMEFFNFILRYPERMSQRVIITGDVGTGKTALAQHFGASITSEANKRAIKFRYAHVNCQRIPRQSPPSYSSCYHHFPPYIPITRLFRRKYSLHTDASFRRRKRLNDTGT